MRNWEIESNGTVSILATSVKAGIRFDVKRGTESLYRGMDEKAAWKAYAAAI